MNNSKNTEHKEYVDSFINSMVLKNTFYRELLRQAVEGVLVEQDYNNTRQTIKISYTRIDGSPYLLFTLNEARKIVDEYYISLDRDLVVLDRITDFVFKEGLSIPFTFAINIKKEKICKNDIFINHQGVIYFTLYESDVEKNVSGCVKKVLSIIASCFAGKLYSERLFTDFIERTNEEAKDE